MRKLYIFFLTIASATYGQQNTPQNGTAPSKLGRYALTNATIIVSPTQTMEKATLIVNQDRIEKIVARDFLLPKDLVVIDCEGKTIVASFIETMTSVGLPAKSTTTANNATFWNNTIHPEVDPSNYVTLDQTAFIELRKAGFGIANIHFADGIARGYGSIISLGQAEIHKHLLKTNSSAYLSFKKGGSQEDYPSSEMGSIALLRQTLYDAQWAKNNPEKAHTNLSLLALNNQLNLPLFFDVTDKHAIFRAQKVAQEFNLNFAYIGSGDEYQRLTDLKTVKSPILVPFNFPDAYSVKDPIAANSIPISMMKHWELAPSNPYFLVKNGNTILLSMYKCKTAEIFWKNMHLAMSRGLTQAEALAALTINPANYLKIDKNLGTLDNGKYASFTIYTGNPFLFKTEVLETWALGERQIISVQNTKDLRGAYKLNSEGRVYELAVAGTIVKPTATIKRVIQAGEVAPTEKTDTASVTAEIIFVDNDLTIQWNAADRNFKGSINLHAVVYEKVGILEGDGKDHRGAWFKWNAYLSKEATADKPKKMAFALNILADSLIWFPNMAFGLDSIPEQPTIVIENGTLWTNEGETAPTQGTIILKNGKISAVNPETFVSSGRTITIDASKKYVTTGIIDEHSHIAISRGVNEGGQAISAEVNIGEVVTNDDINIYRQLAGGVTAAQLLHGSANPIGGQSALIKLKWGYSPEQMLISNAPKFIKFALGENVKQSNWGDNQTYRFPQTRMGVEQVYIDAFSRAKAYDAAKKSFKKGNPLANTFRQDLELEVIAEILNKERFISCHSYVQSEINMLMHVADSFGFKVNTFTHILEGYKVADKMAKHGAAGSTFADWWAYKFEVNDAIPYNAAMMHKAGVLVAINSDDAEMGRRLNQEAAKTIKYGGMTELEAWKMVTLNPAKMLHLDDRMGSMKVGKDADIVVWSDNPLSINARVLYTIIDGAILFDYQRDILMQVRNNQEQARLITKMLQAEKEGATVQEYLKQKEKHFHCDTLGEQGTSEENTH